MVVASPFPFRWCRVPEPGLEVPVPRCDLARHAAGRRSPWSTRVAGSTESSGYRHAGLIPQALRDTRSCRLPAPDPARLTGVRLIVLRRLARSHRWRRRRGAILRSGRQRGWRRRAGGPGCPGWRRCHRTRGSSGWPWRDSGWWRWEGSRRWWRRSDSRWRRNSTWRWRASTRRWRASSRRWRWRKRRGSRRRRWRWKGSRRWRRGSSTRWWGNALLGWRRELVGVAGFLGCRRGRRLLGPVAAADGVDASLFRLAYRSRSRWR